MALARARLIFCSSWNGFRPQSGCNSIPLHVSAGGKKDKKHGGESSPIFF